MLYIYNGVNGAHISYVVLAFMLARIYMNDFRV